MKTDPKEATNYTVCGDVEILPGVAVGAGSLLYGPLVLGFAPRGKRPGELELVIGRRAVIRPFTCIYAGTKIGDDCQTGQCVTIREDNTIGDATSVGTGTSLEVENRIGSRVRIHSNCFLERVVVEDGVFIGPGVVFTDDPHPPCPAFRRCTEPVVVEAGARIGAGAVILPGVRIGRGALVGAGSVVTRDVAPGAVVVGNPARVLKNVDEIECPLGLDPKEPGKS